jgi:hypothetical protein
LPALKKPERYLEKFSKNLWRIFSEKGQVVVEINKRKVGDLGIRTKSKKSDECRVIKVRYFVKSYQLA